MRFKAFAVIPRAGEIEIQPIVLCKECQYFDCAGCVLYDLCDWLSRNAMMVKHKENGGWLHSATPKEWQKALEKWMEEEDAEKNLR